MQNLKEIRSRIASVKSTRQITQAMKMVAAAKLRKVQNRIIQLRPYTAKLNYLLSVLLQSAEIDLENPLFEQRPVNKVLIVAISSNRGLCGAFNANVIKKVQEIIESEYKPQGIEADIYGIGRKASFILRKRGYNVVKEEREAIEKVTYERSKQIAKELIELFLKGDYDKIEFVYNSFKTPGSQLLLREQYLPLIPELKEEHKNMDYIYEPDLKTIIDRLVFDKLLYVKVFNNLLDSNAAEHGARMVAMHQATDNATELIRQLTLTYNKARQAHITKEILEVVNGAEALRRAGW